MAQDTYDAIVIGSGMGGLSFASILARMRGWRVLVLERHFKIGGFTHTFSRPGGWSWDVGLHYVGDLGPGMDGRRLFDFITAGGVQWNPMPDAYDVFVYPGLEIAARAGEAQLRAALIEAFPAEHANIEQYFRDVKAAVAWNTRRFASMVTPAPVSAILSLLNRATARLPLRLTRDYLEARFGDSRLRAVIASQWADYGLPPSQSAFATHAMIAAHYFHGAWYPAGGAGEIARAAGAVIRASGGDLRPNHEVTKIACEHGRAVGVEVRVNQREDAVFRAPVIVSDAGAWNTFARLIPDAPLPFRQQLQKPPAGFEVVELFLGLSRDPREIGFQGENRWIFSGFDHEEMFAQRDVLLEGRAPMAYLSFPSLKDPRARKHTAEVIAPLSHRVLEQHREKLWRRRGEEYEGAKQRIAGALLDLIELHHPGFRNLVEYSELGTPLTFEHFTAAPAGAIYAFPGTPEKYRKQWLRPSTPIPGLYLTGSDAAMHGIMGAMMGGVLAASRVMGSSGFVRIRRAAAKTPP